MAASEKPLHYLTIHEAQQLIQHRDLSPVELTRAVLERINAVDGKLHAYINLMADSALEDARKRKEKLRGATGAGRCMDSGRGQRSARCQGAPAQIRQYTKGVGDATPVRNFARRAPILMGKLAMSSMPRSRPSRAIHGTRSTLQVDRARVRCRGICGTLPGFAGRRHRGIHS